MNVALQTLWLLSAGRNAVILRIVRGFPTRPCGAGQQRAGV